MRQLSALVVDDDVNLRREIARELRNFGYSVAMASDGSEALTLCESEVFDLYIVDFSMPRMNGIDFYRDLRLPRSAKALKIILFDKGEVRDDVVRLGVDAYFEKPLTVREFLGEVSKL